MNIVIIGGGGHAGSVISAIKASGQHEVLGIIDDRFETGSERHGVTVIEMTPELSHLPAFIAIGDNKHRGSYCGYNSVNVIHPSASAPAPETTGTFYGASSYVGPGTKVGRFCIINTGVILEHDSELGDFSHLCPGVVTGGRVKIGHHTTIGLGAMIRDGVTIGNNCTIGMGSVVTKNLCDNSVAYGNPCKWRRYNP